VGMKFGMGKCANEEKVPLNPLFISIYYAKISLNGWIGGGNRMKKNRRK
jgi:hypothetical protein